MYGLQIDRNVARVDAVLSARLAREARRALATIVLVGVQPTLIQVPPTWPRSISATFRPAFAKAMGRSLPPRLLPITIASWFVACAILMFSFFQRRRLCAS